MLSVVWLLCLTAASPNASPANYNAFGVALLQRLEGKSKSENVFISPTSIGIALAMAADGAKGPTRRAILHALRFDGSDLAAANAALIDALGKNHDAAVGVADAIWFRQDLPPRPAYVGLLESGYGAHTQALRFGDPSAASAINTWTKGHTLGLIDRLVEKTSPLDFVWLTNALAFKATWTSQFKKGETALRRFTDADGKRHDVSMMWQRSASFLTLDATTYRALRLPYGQGGFAAYIILPRSNDVDAVVKNLGSGDFDKLAGQMHSEQLAVSLPRLTATYGTSLVPVLRALGMGIAFDSQADFSPMHAGLPLFVSEVLHKAYVRIDEQGTTAAAGTAVEVRIKGPQRAFVVDHPFVLALRDEHTGALLFVGAIRQIPPAK